MESLYRTEISRPQVETNMFRAIGFVIILYALSHYFSASFQAFDSAATETFKAVEAAAVMSQQQFEKQAE